MLTRNWTNDITVLNINNTIMHECYKNVSSFWYLMDWLHLLSSSCCVSVVTELRSTLYYSGKIESLAFTPRSSIYDSAPGWNP